jgi:hypothetical protein
VRTATAVSKYRNIKRKEKSSIALLSSSIEIKTSE